MIVGGYRQELSSDTKARIETLLKSGMSQNKVAKEVGVAPSTVQRLAKKRGLESSRVAPQAAIDARVQYDLAGRLALSNQLFDVIRDQLANPAISPKDVKDLALAFGITTDKRRLEEGESTSRSETRAGGGFNLEAEFAKLDQLTEEWQPPTPNGSEADALEE